MKNYYKSQILAICLLFNLAGSNNSVYGAEPAATKAPASKAPPASAKSAAASKSKTHIIPGNESAPKKENPIPAFSLGEYSSFKPSGDISRFAGEKLFIDISFLWFENAAKANVALYKNKDGSYYSILEAETLGFVGFFTSYRKHVYRAEHEAIDGGKRLRTTRFIREVTIADEVERTVNTMDYNKRVHKWYKFFNDRLFSKGSREIPPNVQFDGILSAFYNFRNGVYGPFKEGADYKIHTIPEKNIAQFDVRVLSSDEENKLRQVEERPPADTHVLRVKIPPEIFKTANGELVFWSSKHLIPIETIVEDYVLLGDLHAKLNRREMSSPVVEGPELKISENPSSKRNPEANSMPHKP